MISGTDTKVTATGGNRTPDIGNGAGRDNDKNGSGGSLTVNGATLEMKNKGTNVDKPKYENCTITDPDGTKEYNAEGNVIASPQTNTGGIPGRLRDFAEFRNTDSQIVRRIPR